MRFFKRGEYWWCSFPWQGATLRRSTRCTTRGAAVLAAQRWERDRADPDHAAAQAATLGSAVAGFLAELERKDVSDSTRLMYRQKCGVLNRILGPDLPLSEINARAVDDFIETRSKEPVAFDEEGAPTRLVTANTIHKELVALRQVLKRARRRGEFRSDPGAVLPVGFSPKYQPRKVALTLEQASKLCASLQAHRAAAVAFVLATGARRSELFRARGEDVDVSSGRVRLRGTKTAGAERTVTVPPFGKELLAFAIKHGRGHDGLLMRPWPNARRGLSHACERVGAPRVTWNDLRRTLSTWLVEGGVSDTVVAKVLGHADTKMLHKVYGKPREDAVGELLARQTASLRPVRVLYVSPAESSRTGQNRFCATPGKYSKPGGPSGTRTRDLRIKSPQLYRLSYRPGLFKGARHIPRVERLQHPNARPAWGARYDGVAGRSVMPGSRYSSKARSQRYAGVHPQSLRARLSSMSSGHDATIFARTGSIS
jgi:integrase